MTTVDPDGEWKLGVFPDGEVVDLAPAPAKGRAAVKVSTPRPKPGGVLVGEPPALPPAPPKDLPTVVLERTTERTVIAPRVPRQTRQAGTGVATLKFSTGETAIIGPPAIIGRNPRAHAADTAPAPATPAPAETAPVPAAAGAVPADDMLDAVLWMQQSVEYEGAATTGFTPHNTARSQASPLNGLSTVIIWYSMTP